MADKVTTTKTFGNFPNRDVTHKPRRYQSQIDDEIGNTEVTGGDTLEVNISNIPQSPTLESAIKYFTESASGLNAKLYTRTAGWLKELIEARQKLKDAVKNGGAE